MDPEVRQLIAELETRPPAEVERLRKAAADAAVTLPQDYLEFMGTTNGASGHLGLTWIEFWSADEILRTAEDESPYEEVFLFAGDGANTIYGFDARANSEIVEGDWIGLSRDELVRHGHSFSEFLARLASRR